MSNRQHDRPGTSYVNFYLDDAHGTDGGTAVVSELRLDPADATRLTVELTARSEGTFARGPLYGMVGATIDALTAVDGTVFRGVVFAVTIPGDDEPVRLDISLEGGGLGEDVPLSECALAPELVSALHMVPPAELRPEAHDEMVPHLLTLDFPAAPGSRFAPEVMEQWKGRPVNVVRHRDGTVTTGTITAAAVLQNGAAAAVTIAVNGELLFADLHDGGGPYSAAAADG
jgi:hypothetical protein